MGCCKKDMFVLFKGYSSRWNAVDWLSINFTGIIDTEGFSARFRIGDYTFTTNDLSQEWIINLTNEQTATLPLGINTASLIIYDTAGEGKPFTTNIPILVKDWEDGDVTIDTYKATIKATLENETQLTINVEAGISVEVIPQVITLPAGSNAYVQNIGTSNHLILKFGIPQGEKGEEGNGIDRIEKTATSGLIDTYTIYYTDGNQTTYEVKNGERGPAGKDAKIIIRRL